MADSMAAENLSRSAVNIERARAVGISATPSVRGKQQQQPTIQRNTVQRSGAARTVSARATTTNPQQTKRTATRVSRAANFITQAGNAIIRRAFGIGRSATNTTVARSAAAPKARSAMPMGASRARATAVFNDMSKLGGGYNTCREAYNTCMDQFCAGMNETYRRCFCSNNFRNLRDKEEALDTATTMLARFEDNNLNAVDKTADEVNAMYSATAGEAAIKKDTSASSALLDEIGDLLSGKKKASDAKTMTSLTGLSIDFSSDLGDIWSSNSSDSFFNMNDNTDLTSLEGMELYNNAHSQCMQVINDSCGATAVRNMVKSAYGVLITQDCNAYQKKLDSKTEQVKQTVRTAEKYLREARLEEYRSHNSADVNECMDKVEQAILAPTACGPNYEKCLDNTGVYINSTTGEPIYSPRLFKLNEVISLNGTSSDVLGQNPTFDKFLDSKRMYAKAALDTCRTISDTVWTEFKRNALIKIAQAQDEKLEEVKMSCVTTMKDCYDSQSDQLKSFDDTTAQAAGALAARASRDMCADKVAACAALYAPDGAEACKVDSKGKISNMSTCGLASLRNFVNTVDDARIAEGCATAVQNYLKQLCTPTTGDKGYPWNCRQKRFAESGVDVYNLQVSSNNLTTLTGRSALPMSVRAPTTNTIVQAHLPNVNNLIVNNSVSPNNSVEQHAEPETRSTAGSSQITYKKGNNDNFVQMVMNYAFENCGVEQNGIRKLEARTIEGVSLEIQNAYNDMANLLSAECEALDGLWVDVDYNGSAGGLSAGNPVEAFYDDVYGTTHSGAQAKYSADAWGRCVKNDMQARCLLANEQTGNNGWARYENGTCIFTSEYYKYQCEQVRGVWANGYCYVTDE